MRIIRTRLGFDIRAQRATERSGRRALLAAKRGSEQATLQEGVGPRANREVRPAMGQTLLDAVLAIAILAAFGAAVAGMVAGSFAAFAAGAAHTEASALAQEGMEAVRAIRDAAWNTLAYDQSGVSANSGTWALRGEGTTDILGPYTRAIAFRDVCRDASGNRVGCPGVSTDVESVEAAVTISWTTPSGSPASLERVSEFTNWNSRWWEQTDWVGGAGQAVWSDATKYDSGDRVTTTVAGRITLASKTTAAWELVQGGGEEYLHGVGIRSTTDAWAVGEDGSMRRWNGTQWASVNSGTDRYLNAAVPLAANDAWVVGNSGVIRRWNGTQWSAVSSGTTNHLHGLAFRVATDGWAVGDGGKILRWNGAQWSTVNSPSNQYLNDIAVLSATDAWIVGNNGTILRWNGSAWSTMQSPTSRHLHGVAFRNATDGWAVGNDGNIIRWNGSQWTSVLSPVTNHLNGIAIISESDAWTVGNGGTIIRWDGTQWTTVQSPTTQHVSDVMVDGAGGGWAVGAQGTILRLTAQANGLESNGTLTSSAFPFGSASPAQIVAWDAVIPACVPACTVRAQIQTAPDVGGVPGAWSPTWSGPDGTGDGDETDYYTIGSGQRIHTDHNGDRWVRYRVALDGDGTQTPTVDAIRVNYR